MIHCRSTAGGDALKVEMHRRWRCTEGGDAPKVEMHRRWRCTEGGDAAKVEMHRRWRCTEGGIKDRDQGSGSSPTLMGPTCQGFLGLVLYSACNFRLYTPYVIYTVYIYVEPCV